MANGVPQGPNLVDLAWSSQVVHLEESAQLPLGVTGQDAAAQTSIRLLRHFVLSNLMNKAVVAGSQTLLDRLMTALSGVEQAAASGQDLPTELLDLTNSIARDSAPFRKQVGQVPLLQSLLRTLLTWRGMPHLTEAILRFLRTVFQAEDLGATLFQSSQQELVALAVFPHEVLSDLVTWASGPVPTDPHYPLTPAARARLLELLSVLATSGPMARRLFQVDALPLAHAGVDRLKTVAADPVYRSSAKFCLKIILHLLFHVDDALEALQSVMEERDPRRLVSCYNHVIQSWTGTCSSPPRLADQRTRCMLGLCRGVLLWRLVRQSAIPAVTSSGEMVMVTGLGITDDEIALWVIQPLTESCLYLETNRVIAWVCHLLYLVLSSTACGGRVGLHYWTVYTNNFLREVDTRVAPLLTALRETSDKESVEQFLEHLIPLIKLFSCLASSEETIRVWIGDLAMTLGLIDFCTEVTPPTADAQESIVLEFQKSLALLMHVLSRSICLHRTYFQRDAVGKLLIELARKNCGRLDQPLRAGIVEAASSALVNLVLPFSPMRQPLCEAVCDLFINLTTDASVQSDHPAIQLNGVWGLLHLTHAVPRDTREAIYRRLAPGAWMEILRAAVTTPTPRQLLVMAGSEQEQVGVGAAHTQIITGVEQQQQLVHKTLALLRNLLRDDTFIDFVVERHWWDIVQLIISVLESGYRHQAVNEQAILVLAHITTGLEARRHVVGNEDLLEKIKFFMMSSNSQVKAAAYTAAHNLLRFDLHQDSGAGNGDSRLWDQHPEAMHSLEQALRDAEKDPAVQDTRDLLQHLWEAGPDVTTDVAGVGLAGMEDLTYPPHML